MLKLKQSLARNLFRLFIVLIIFKAPAVLAVTCPTWFGGQLCDGGGKSWCYQNNITNGCQVETTCSPISNGTNTNNCLTNTCVIECSEGYIECSSNCQIPLSKPANCSTHNPCTGVCTVCNAGYELSGSSTCVSAILKLGINSVSGSNVVQAATGALLYVNNTGVGIGTNNPSSSLHIIGHVTLSEDLSMAAGKSIKLNNAANTILYIGNYHTGGFAFGSGQTASIHVEGDVRANKLCIKDDCKSAWSEIQGTNYWTASGNNISANNSGNVGIGTASPVTKLHVVGTIRTSLSGTGNRCLYVTSDGDIAAKSVDCGTATGGDNLGDHIATQNIKLGNYWLSGDGGDEGIFVNSSGKVGIGTTNPVTQLSLDNTNNGLTGSNANNTIRLTDTDTTTAVNQPIGKIEFFSSDTTSPGAGVKSYILSSAAGTSGGGDFRFGVSANGGTVSEMMRLSSLGDIGIGTTSPAAKLAVAGTGLFTGVVTVPAPTENSHAANKNYVDSRIVPWNKIDAFPTACGTGQYVQAIGSTLTCGTPASTAYTAGGGLTLTGSVFSVDTTVVRTTGTQTIAGAKTFSTTPLTLSAASAILNFSSTSGTKEISTGAGTHLNLNPGNNVGIGTTSPAAKLAVAGTGLFTGVVTVPAPTENSHAANKNYVDGRIVPWNKIDTFPTACGAGQYVQAIGSTLTCGTPASTAYTAGGGLTLTGSVFSVDTTVVRTTGTQTIGGAKTFSTTPLTLSAASAKLNFSSTSGTKEISTGAGTHLNLNPGNNVGIGTTSPAAKLAVAGTGLFTGVVTVPAPTENSHAANKNYVDGRIVPWNKIDTFPAACGNGQYVRAIGSTLTCGTPTGTSHNPLTLGDIGSSPNVTGASLDDQKLMLQPASASFGGVVTTGSQAFAGTKTFNSTIIGNINTATALANDGTNCSAGYYPLGIDASGNAQNCTVLPTGGTYSADGRGIELSGGVFSLKLDGTTLSKSELGLKVNAITNNQISGLAGIVDTKLATITTANKVSGSAVQLALGGGLENSTGLKIIDGIYAKLAGVSGGQNLIGGTAANNTLTFQGNSAASGNTSTGINMSFKVGNGGGTNAMTILNNGNIGINRTDPTQKLHVKGNIDSYVESGTGSIGFSIVDAFTTSGGQTAHYGLTRNSFGSNTIALSGYGGLGLFTNGSERLRINSSGNVGIGTNSPGTKLHVEGGIMVSSGSNNIHIYNEAGQALINYDNSDFGAKLIIRKFDEDMMTFASGPEVTIGDGGANSKLDVGTVDPIYTIDETRYATYMAGMTGVKEETSGALVLDKQSAGLFMAKIDFQNSPAGSDIWLFGRTANLINNQNHFDQTACLLTSNFAGQAWYEKDWASRSINIFARPDNDNRTSIEVSYRLTAPRFDSEKWTNYGDSQHDGFNLDELLK